MFFQNPNDKDLKTPEGTFEDDNYFLGHLEKSFDSSLDAKGNSVFEMPKNKFSDDFSKEIPTPKTNNIKAIKALVEETKKNLEKIEILLSIDEENFSKDNKTDFKKLGDILKTTVSNEKAEEITAVSENQRVIEGIFNGESMIGQDGKEYSVPQNYASKSKLVEGDVLKLTIANNGSFIFKQIGPIERHRVASVLEYDLPAAQYYAVSDNRRWKLLTASVTYFKGQPKDEVIILIPAKGFSEWAAVENIIKKIVY